MRKIAAIILTILYQIGLCSGVVSDQTVSQDLGVPSSESYTQKQVISRVPWDMVIVDDKLYLGGGDYNDNTGPVDIWCYDLTSKEWSVSGTLNDEAIGKFVTIGDRVYAPGFDSKASTWEYGNYHWLEDGQWQTNTLLPDAVHNFDIAEFEDKLFFALGTADSANSPVKVSADQGSSFSDVSFFRDGVDILANGEFDFSRVYDFFIIDDSLYCMFLSVQDGKVQNYEFYKYDNEAFHFVSTNDQIKLYLKKLKQEPICSKITYKGNCYIAGGYLNRTADFQSSEWLMLPFGEFAVDLLVDGETLYVLSCTNTEEGYSIRIYAYVYNSFFYPVASFEAANFPASFVKQGNTFYVGMSHQGTEEDVAGCIHEIQVPELTLRLINDCL